MFIRPRPAVRKFLFDLSLRRSSPPGKRRWSPFPSPSHTEDVAVDFSIISPTEGTKGNVIYTTRPFTKEGLSVQTKSIEILALNDMSVMQLPCKLTTIEDEAFENLNCEAIIIPSTCTSIGNHAFRNCKNLKYVQVLSSVTIPKDAFEGCGHVVIDRVSE